MKEQVVFNWEGDDGRPNNTKAAQKCNLSEHF